MTTFKLDDFNREKGELSLAIHQAIADAEALRRAGADAPRADVSNSGVPAGDGDGAGRERARTAIAADRTVGGDG